MKSITALRNWWVERQNPQAWDTLAEYRTESVITFFGAEITLAASFRIQRHTLTNRTRKLCKPHQSTQWETVS